MTDEGSDDYFAVNCTLDRSAVWRDVDSTNSSPRTQSEATLLAPEFDFSPITKHSRFQAQVTGSLYVYRADGVTLSESYPEATTTDDGWSVGHSNWAGGLSNLGEFRYTDQLALLIANRSANRSDQDWLFWGGMAMGLAASLVVRSLSDIADGFLRSGSDHD